MRTWALLVTCSWLMACGGDDGGTRRPGRDTGVDDVAGSVDVGFDDAVPGNDPGLDGAIPPDAGPDVAPPDLADPDAIAPTPDVSTDLPPRSLDCKQFYQQCVNLCPKGADNQPEDACFAACHAQLSTEGRAVADALIECVEMAGCEGLTDAGQALTCFADACSEQYFACFHGNDACKDVLTCMGGCAQGDGYNACVVTCSQDGTEEAQKQLIGILQCIGQTCCPADAAACGTPEGKQCSKDAVGVGGACFGQVSECLMGF